MTVFTYGENGQPFAVAPSANAPTNSGALVITTNGIVQVSGPAAAVTASFVVGPTAGMQLAQTSLAAPVTIDGAVKRTLSVQFQVVGANGIVYYLLATASAT